jgi:glycosyltransferase involved in cell wall biosynthesis
VAAERPAAGLGKGRVTKASLRESCGDVTDIEGMRVLILTTHEAGLIDQQRSALEKRGLAFEQLVVPGDARSAGGHDLSDYLRFLPSVLRRSLDSFDLIHANYGLTGPAAVLQPRLPVVLSVWGSDLYGSLGSVTRFCARFSEETVVMSRRMADDLGSPATVVPHGVDFERFAPVPRAAAREELGWDEDVRVVLFPYSKDRSVKDHPRAERIVDRVADRLDDPVELRTVSGLDHDAVPTYMNAADALLLTSKREGSPNTVKEALATNTPVVATDVGDVRERVAGVERSTVSDDDETLAAGLVEALESEGRPASREAAREVSIERTTADLLDVYRRAAAAGPSPVIDPASLREGVTRRAGDRG